MKLTKKELRKVLCAILFCMALSPFTNTQVHAQQEQQPAALDALTATFKNGKALNAVFQHQVIDSFTKDTTLQRGEIWLTANAYKISTETTTLLVDGEISRVYDKLKNRMIISNYDPSEDDFAPSQLLTDVQSRYSSAVQQTEGERTLIILTSDDIFSTFQRIEICLKKQHVPIKIIAVDQVDNRLVTTFNNPFFVAASPGMFQIVAPENAEIVDLRP